MAGSMVTSKQTWDRELILRPIVREKEIWERENGGEERREGRKQESEERIREEKREKERYHQDI